MNKLRRVFIVALLVFFEKGNAQDCGLGVTVSPLGGVLGGAFRRPPPPKYNFVREADVMWSKRYWRVLDLREKINHVYFFPVEPTEGRVNLTTAFLNSICQTELIGYDAMSDEFTIQLTRAEVAQMTSGVDTIYVEDEEGRMIETPITNPFDPSAVKRVRVKEDWYFDNQLSSLEQRIIGICPVMEKFDENGEYKGEMPLFWIYYPAARNMLQSTKVQNFRNVAEPFTYDRLLQMRYFSSYVYKVSNVYDRQIQDYKVDLDALLEGERIETELFNMEQDLWEY